MIWSWPSRLDCAVLAVDAYRVKRRIRYAYNMFLVYPQSGVGDFYNG